MRPRLTHAMVLTATATMLLMSLLSLVGLNTFLRLGSR